MDKRLKALDAARARKLPWIEVAQALDEIERHGLVDHEARPWIKVAAEASGYTANHLRRFQAAARFVRQIANEHLPIEKIAVIGATTLEPLSRLWAINPQIGADYLEAVLSRGATYRDITRALQDLAHYGVSPISVGRNAAQNFRFECKLAVESNFSKLGLRTAIEAKSGHIYPAPDFLTIADELLIGIDIFDIKDKDSGYIVKKIALPSVSKATFLDVLWIITAAPESHELVSVLNKLGRHNIGQIVLTVDRKHVETIVEPSGPPFPNRRGIWISEMPPWLREAINKRGWRLPPVSSSEAW